MDRELSRNSAWMLGAQLTRTALQAGYFVVLARILGPGGYGVFVSITAAMGIVAPFCGWGSGDLLVQRVARRPECFREEWGNALLMTVSTGAAFFALLALALWLLVPANFPPAAVLSIALADLILLRVIDTCAQAFRAVERLDRTAVLQAAPVGARLAGLVVLVTLTSTPTLAGWVVAYAAGTLVCAAGAVWLTARELGGAVLPRRLRMGDLREGFYFSLSLSAQSAYNDIDKTMLGGMGDARGAGVYAVAYRMVDVAFSPIRSVLYSSYARFFRHGSRGVVATATYAWRLLPIAIAYGLLAAVSLLAGAPLVSRIVGPQFDEAVSALRWLSMIPVLRAVHFFAADSLTGAGYQRIRSLLQVVVGMMNVILNLLLIPKFGWLGAAWTSIASDTALAISLWVTIAFLYRRESQGSEALAQPDDGAARPEPMGGEESILVFRIGHLGDTIVALPAVHAIRREHPRSRLAILTDRPGRTGFVPAWEIFRSAGVFDQAFFYTRFRRGIPALGMLLRLSRQIRRFRPAILYYLPPSPRSRRSELRDRFFFRYCCGIRDIRGLPVVGYEQPVRDLRGGLPRIPSEVQRLVEVVRAPAGRAGRPGPALPLAPDLMRIDPKRREAVDRLWRESGLPANGCVVAVAPSSKMPAKRWPVERFAELGTRLLASDPSLHLVLLGGGEDQPVCDALCHAWGTRAVNFAGRTSIVESAEVLRRCTVYVGNDTGTMHLAAAVGTRCVAIFSARDYPGKWEPMGEGHTILRKAVSCEGCMLEHCVERRLVCLSSIAVDEVTEAVLHSLPSAAAAGGRAHEKRLPAHTPITSIRRAP